MLLQPEQMSVLLLAKPKYLRVIVMKYLTQIITEVRHILIWDNDEDRTPNNVPPFALNKEKFYTEISSLKQIECGIGSFGELSYLKTVNLAN